MTRKWICSAFFGSQWRFSSLGSGVRVNPFSWCVTSLPLPMKTKTWRHDQTQITSGIWQGIWYKWTEMVSSPPTAMASDSLIAILWRGPPNTSQKPTDPQEGRPPRGWCPVTSWFITPSSKYIYIYIYNNNNKNNNNNNNANNNNDNNSNNNNTNNNDNNIYIYNYIWSNHKSTINSDKP